MKYRINIINQQGTPITEDTFKRQKWIRIDDEDDNIKFYNWILPLPSDNPDEDAPFLISSINDEYIELGIKKGEYVVEINGFNGLGFCEFEEEIELLYKVLTHQSI